MRWGIVTAAVIAVARSLWLSLIVDRTISKHRGRPMRTRSVFSLALSLLPFAGGEAFAAERRVALVIGNSSYIHAPALDNPVNDVTAVSVMLEGAGFQVVETRNNLDNTAMRRVVEYPDCVCGQGRVDGERRRWRAQPIHHRAAETPHRARTRSQDRLRQGT